jgi:antirestriction protein ArdC
MPEYAQFTSREGYYATLVHELTHWSGGESRLNRDMSGRFKTAAYAAEELIAEMGAAFLCADLGITPDIREDHAAYLHSWLGVLKGDKKAIFTAAAHAQRAVDYLHSLQGDPSAS